MDFIIAERIQTRSPVNLLLQVRGLGSPKQHDPTVLLHLSASPLHPNAHVLIIDFIIAKVLKMILIVFFIDFLPVGLKFRK